ncbi:hypothetical protein BOX15_Mlig023160g1, partial [Macrostomum lignano]
AAARPPVAMSHCPVAPLSIFGGVFTAFGVATFFGSLAFVARGCHSWTGLLHCCLLLGGVTIAAGVAALPLCRRDYRSLRYYRGLAIAVLLLSAASFGLAIAGSTLFWLNFAAGVDGVLANRACDGMGSFMFYIMTAALGLILSFSQMLMAFAVCCSLKPQPPVLAGVAFHASAPSSAPASTSVQLPSASSDGADAAAPLVPGDGLSAAPPVTLC